LTTYRAWAQLNLKGKEEWGNIFSNGKIPVKTIAAQKVKLMGVKDPESAFSVDWKALSGSQQEAILEKLGQENGKARKVVLEELLKGGLAIGRSNFCCYGTLNNTFWI
jgi:hypothetical protein